MAQFLYITEVFCPWCYGFSPVISKIKDLYALPFRVICGALIEEATSLAKRLERTPNIEAFIDRMYSITNVRISDNYVKMLRSSQNKEIYMNSQKGGLLFYGLKHFNEAMSLEIMKDLQDMLYGKGQDVLSDVVLHEMCKKYSFDFETVSAFMQLEETKELAFEETEFSFDIMEDVVLYPTLYYVDDFENRYFISRGFTEYETCTRKINAVIEASKQGITPEDFEKKQERLYKEAIQNAGKNRKEEANIKSEAPLSCSLDGKCE